VDNKSDVVAEIELVEQPIEVLTVFNERVRVNTRVVELVGVALPDQVGHHTASLVGDMGHDVAPEIRGRRVAVQEQHRVA